MTLASMLKFTGRTLIGASVADLGRQALMNPGGRVQMAEPTMNLIRKYVDLPFDDEAAVRINGGVQAVGGVMLSLGIFPRIAAAAMVGSLIPTTQAGHPFWKYDEDTPERAQQRTQFQKNLAMMGGLVFIMAGNGDVKKDAKKEAKKKFKN